MNTSETSREIAASPLGPPKVPIVFRIGVVGHRPNRLHEADLPVLAERIGMLLTTISYAVAESHQEHRDLYDNSQPVIRALSPLAEGTDRIFAEEARNVGCKLTAVLPFQQAEYEKDFVRQDAEPGSVQKFREFLEKAETVFELDGTRAEQSRAYGIAGRVVLNQSDVLIVVWDGERRNLVGGTEETLDAALEQGVPVALILAHSPHHWRIITKPLHEVENLDGSVRLTFANSSSPEELTKEIRRLTDLHKPEPVSDEHGHNQSVEAPREGLEKFYAETQRKWKLSVLWKVFRDAVGDGKFSIPQFHVKNYEDDVESNWPRDRSNPVAWLIDRLRPFYAWPDKLADLYADRYRSAFVAAFGCSALAVAMALGAIGLNLGHHSIGAMVFAVGESIAISFIIAVVAFGRRGQWHQHWLDYRLLAEMIRHQRLVVQLGGEPATPIIPLHLVSYGDPGVTWMAWYARALERSLGLPTARVDAKYLQDCLKDLYEQIGGGRHGQIGFHRATYERSERIEHRLHLAEVGLLSATLACSLLHIFQEPWHVLTFVPPHILTFCCGFFPAFGAALAGINNQGEFRRIELRSKSMAGRLKKQFKQIKELQDRVAEDAPLPRQLSADVAKLASEAARMMVTEVLDYRVIFQDRPLKTT